VLTAVPLLLMYDRLLRGQLIEIVVVPIVSILIHCCLRSRLLLLFESVVQLTSIKIGDIAG
jgi:hypothetical protein